MAEINKVNNYKTVYRGGTAEIVEKSHVSLPIRRMWNQRKRPLLL